MVGRRRATMLAGLVLLVACSPAATAPSTVSAAGPSVRASGAGTVQQALAEAGIAVPAGRLLAVRSQRPLGPDLRPGRVLVDGSPTSLAAPVVDGAVITVEPGGDATEPVETVVLPVPANGGIASLRKDARPGLLRVVRGAVSHEVVSRQTIKKAYDGTLLSARPVALTFDDGPSPQWTPPILRELARAHVHATFCLVGREAVKYPNLVKAIVAGGHRLCNHTWSHDEQLAHRSASQIVAEMTRAQDAITQASGGVAPQFFRAPGGGFSGQVNLLARRLHMTPLTWNVDPRDWARPGTAHVVGAVLSSVRPGSIVLLHDGGGRRDQTVAALRFFLSRLPAAHYVFWVPRTA